MEENKSKVVPLNAQKPEKMSYEELENVAHQLSEQSRQLYTKLQDMNMTNVFKRLDYLFKVIENSTKFSNEFVHNCISEIETIMTVSEETEEDKAEE